MAFRTVELTGPAEIHVRNGALLVEKEIPNSKDVNKAGDTANTLTRGGNWSIVKSAGIDFGDPAGWGPLCWTSLGWEVV